MLKYFDVRQNNEDCGSSGQLKYQTTPDELVTTDINPPAPSQPDWGVWCCYSPNGATITGANDSLLVSFNAWLTQKIPKIRFIVTQRMMNMKILVLVLKHDEMEYGSWWKIVNYPHHQIFSSFLQTRLLEPSVRIFWAGGCEVGQVTCYAMLGDDQWHGHSSCPVQPVPAQFPNFPQQECGLTTSHWSRLCPCYTHIPMGKYLWGKIIQIFEPIKLEKYSLLIYTEVTFC